MLCALLCSYCVAPKYSCILEKYGKIILFLQVPKFWNTSQNLNNGVNGYRADQSHCTCGF